MTVPALRFPEFEGEWEEQRLGRLATFSKGKGISKADISEGGNTPCIRYGQLYTHYGTKIDTVLSATNVAETDLNLSVGGEVIVPASGEDSKDIATASVILRSGIAIGGDLNVIKGEFDGYFLANYISGTKRLALAAMAQGNSVVHLYPSQLASLVLSFPSLPEQKKIAAFLGVVDEKLVALGARKAGLETYKRGLMQKLFSRTLRFTKPDGSPFPDWEEKKFSEFLLPTLRPVPKPLSNYLAIGLRSHGKGTFQKPDSDPAKIAMDTLYLVRENDLVVNITFAWEGAIAIVPREDDGGHVSHRFPTYRFQEDRVSREFFRIVILDRRFRQKLELISPGGAGRNRVMSKPDFLKLRQYFPHPDEQRLIADAFQSMDAKIQTVTDQIARMETFKKGLLQQMFV